MVRAIILRDLMTLLKYIAGMFQLNSLSTTIWNIIMLIFVSILYLSRSED